MRWRKYDLWKAGIPFIGLLFLLVIMVWVPVSANAYEGKLGLIVTGTLQATPTVDATVTELNKEKLFQDIAQQQHTIGNWFWSNGAALVSSLVLVIAGFFTLLRYLRDQQNERDKQLREWEKQREDRQTEREKRDEERFQSVIAGLGSSNLESRAGAAIMLRTFLQPGYSRFYQQAFDLAVTHLRLRHVDSDIPETTNSLSLALITVFKESFPLARNRLGQVKSSFDTRSLDASRVRLDGAFLTWSDLSHIWMLEAFLVKANLAEANLSQANLIRANLSSTNLHQANLSGTQLYAANLSRATLTEANLSGTNLEQADLSGAYLRGVNFKEVSSLKKTNLRGVKGLTKEQKEACKAMGAIIDEDIANNSSQPTASPPAQSSTAQTLASPAQVNTPAPNTDGSSSASSQPSEVPKKE